MEAVLERPKYECLLFDLDDTLYPFSVGINLSCRKNIEGELRQYSFFMASCFIKYLLSTNVEEPAILKFWPPDFMRHHLLIEESQIAKMCLDLYKEYGTTMAGLKALGYEFDNDEFHANVHGTLPYHNLRPDPVLRTLLLSIPQRKIVCEVPSFSIFLLKL